jgi:hypothetical protein
MNWREPVVAAGAVAVVLFAAWGVVRQLLWWIGDVVKGKRK